MQLLACLTYIQQRWWKNLVLYPTIRAERCDPWAGHHAEAHWFGLSLSAASESGKATEWESHHCSEAQVIGAIAAALELTDGMGNGERALSWRQDVVVLGTA